MDNQLLTSMLREMHGIFLDGAPVRCYLMQMPRSVEPTESVRDGESPRITVTLPKSDYEEVCRLARNKRVSNAWVIRDAVEKYIAADSPLFSQYTSAS
jgi:hypothetical protein